MVVIRPRRLNLNLAALALDAPLPLIVTCAGRDLPWPTGTPQAICDREPRCACGNALDADQRICDDCDAFADDCDGVGTGPRNP